MERPTTAFNKSLTKAVSVLKCFTPQALELGAADVARKVGLPKTTAHRILRTFADARLLEQNVTTSRYTIGPLLYMLGNLYLSSTDVLKAAEPVLKEISNLTGIDVSLGIFDKGYITVVMRVLGRFYHPADYRIGTVVPAHTSSMGKAFLSELTDDEVDRFYPRERLFQRTPKTIPTKTELRKQLEQIRKTGMSFTREEGSEGVEGIASLIRDHSGKAVAAMSFHLPVFKANQGVRRNLAGLIKRACGLVSYRLGYRDTKDPVHELLQIRSWWEEIHSAPGK
jgi:DNA-binding IclR family transcriptional regulator